MLASSLSGFTQRGEFDTPSPSSNGLADWSFRQHLCQAQEAQIGGRLKGGNDLYLQQIRFRRDPVFPDPVNLYHERRVSQGNILRTEQ